MVTYEAVDWYDLPLYYDIVFSPDTSKEADFLEDVDAIYGRTRGRQVLEPACGSGRLVEEMARRGWRVTGFDDSPAMLSFTRRRLRDEGLTASLSRRRLESFTYRPKFDLAHCLISTFKYLPDEDSARSHLQGVANALKPGGLYVLGLHLTDYEERQPGHEQWRNTRDGIRVTCTIESWPPDRRRRRERVRSRLVVREPDRTRRFETTWWFRTYSARQLRRLLRSVPAFEHVASYDFHCEVDRPVVFDDRQLDRILVLRKRQE